MKSRRHFFKRIAIFLSIMGPGIITANVDNDANGIATYSVAGASFGYSMLWYLIFIALGVALIQEMSSRMGCITGKGLADLIRENFGIKFTFLVILVLFLANLANTVGNLAGLAAAGELFKIPKYISVIGGAFIIWLLVIKGSYEKIEKVFLFACLIYFTYIFSGVLAHPDWQEVFKATLNPSFHFNSHYLNIVIALVGTSIAPWMQFYQQSAVRDKGIRPKEYIYARYDTWIGTLMMMIVAFFIVVACATTLHIKGISINTAEEAALALTPVAGKYCEILFAIGLINAALFSASIIPISTSYAICEAFGWESGIGQSFKEAKIFYFIYTFILMLSVILVLIPKSPLILIMVMSQTLNGMLLPFILITMLLLINNQKLMGKWKNSFKFNLISWIFAITLSVLSLMLIFSLFI